MLLAAEQIARDGDNGAVRIVVDGTADVNDSPAGIEPSALARMIANNRAMVVDTYRQAERNGVLELPETFSP